MVPTIGYLQRLDSYGIAFHSYTESHLNTDNELVRNILLALLSSLAKVETQKLSARVKAGMVRARASGKRIGRPSLPVYVRQQIRKRLDKGETPYRIAKDMKISQHTVAKYREVVS
jgi:DNA invertase Pin-like site-specific DNA recombinase